MKKQNNKARDYVLVRIKKFESKHKIEDKFKKEVYEMVEQPREEIPVYKLRSLDTNIENNTTTEPSAPGVK